MPTARRDETRPRVLDGRDGVLMDRYLQIVVYVLCLFFFWNLAPMTILLAGLPLARRLGVIANARGYSTVAAPVFAAFERILSLFVMVALPLGALVIVNGGNAAFPVVGSSERVLAERIFGIGFVVYIAGFVPISLGLPLVTTAHQLPFSSRIPLMLFRWGGGYGIGGLTMAYTGEYCWLIALCGIVYAGLLGVLTLQGVAIYNCLRAPNVVIGHGRSAATWYFLHVSDIHCTFPAGAEPAGGGNSGMENLNSIASKLVAKDGSPKPKMLLDTGDVVDRGRPEEWDEPRRLFTKIKESGIRVVIAPGNHDLVPTYSFVDSVWATAGKRFMRPEMDGTRLWNYLSIASQLEPNLVTCNGTNLKGLIEAEKNRLEQLHKLWDSARDQALDSLAMTGGDHQAVLRRVRGRQPTIASNISDAFGSRAHILFPEWSEAEWKRLLFDSSPKITEWAVPYRKWGAQWTELFPLRLEVPEDGVEILILNSIAQEPRLAASARGRCGARQLERTKERLQASKAKVVIVMHHNAPFRFPRVKGEPFVARWAMLAHDPDESQTLAQMLEASSTKHKQVLLLCGHIHMRSRFGQLSSTKPGRAGKVTPVWVMESGALGEPTTDVLPTGWMAASGKMHPQLWKRPRDLARS